MCCKTGRRFKGTTPNTISARMKRMLVFPTTNWKVNIYTSRFVKMYMNEKDHQK
jgi:hypothetical protein